MIKGGLRRKGGGRSRQDEVGYSWAYLKTNRDIIDAANTEAISSFVDRLQIRWIGHCVRRSNDNLIKQLTFENTKISRFGHHLQTPFKRVLKLFEHVGYTRDQFIKAARDREELKIWKERSSKCERGEMALTVPHAKK